MKVVFVAACLLGIAGANEVKSQAPSTTPMGQVLVMLDAMKSSVLAGTQDEKVAHAAHMQHCRDTVLQLERHQMETKRAIARLTRDNQETTTKLRNVKSTKADLDNDVAGWTAQITKLTQARTNEREIYEEKSACTATLIASLHPAITFLKTSRPEPSASVLLQTHVGEILKSTILTDAQRQSLDAFLETGDSAAPTYAFRSEGIIGILEEMLEKFSEEHETTETEEVERQHAFNQMLSDVQNRVAESQIHVGETNTKIENAENKLVAIEDEKNQQTEIGASTEIELCDMNASCKSKQETHDQTMALREEEVSVIDQALEILQSHAVLGEAGESLTPDTRLNRFDLAFAQLRADALSEIEPMQKTLRFLRNKAAAIDSKVLSALAEKVESGRTPLDEVKHMIQQLIYRLGEEANKESSHKTYCDTRLATNDAVRKASTDFVEDLKTNLDQLKIEIKTLEESIKKETDSIAAAKDAQKVADTLRTESKEANAKTVEEMSTAAKRVNEAIVVLKNFYAKKSSIDPLQKEEKDGVIGMMEVLEADFSRHATRTAGDETTSVTQYRTESQERSTNIGKSEGLLASENRRKDERTAEQVRDADRLSSRHAELSTAMDEYQDLKKICVDAFAEGDNRRLRRKREIESLQMAMKILQARGAGTIDVSYGADNV